LRLTTLCRLSKRPPKGTQAAVGDIILCAGQKTDYRQREHTLLTIRDPKDLDSGFWAKCDLRARDSTKANVRMPLHS